LTDYFRERPGVVGLFVSGSVAEGTADAWSDLDVRVVVEEKHFKQFCAQRHTAPESWGQLFFNTGAMGPHMCVSHFAPLVKVDVFYYRPADLVPSPWIARGVRVLLDEHGVVRDLMERSAGMTFRADLAEVDWTINNAFANAHEVVRRVERGELAYAQSLLAAVRWHIAVAEAYLHDRPPTALAHFETDCDDRKVLQAVADSHPPHNAESIMAALKGLLPLLRRQIASLGQRFSLGRDAERDEASMAVVEGWDSSADPLGARTRATSLRRTASE
jgi:predicted nucleotidyltransferase